MTRDDIHKLIAGYATGTLTEEERQALFTAALEDQELFDQLAREQEWKEALDEPGVRQRLIVALEPAREPVRRKQAWWEKKHWTWAAAATAAAILLGVYLSQPREPKRLAVVLPQERPLPNAPAPFVAPPPEDQPAPSLPAPAAVDRGRRGVTPQLPPPLRTERSSADQTSPAVPRQEVVAPVTAAAPPPPPAPKPTVEASARSVTELPQISVGAAKGGGRGGRGVGAVGGVVQNQFVEKVAAPSFSFDYSVSPDRRLHIVPQASGFLSVSVAGQVLVTNRFLPTGSPTDIALPEEATVATVVFSSQQITDSILSLAKSSLDAPSGSKSDPNPSPASRLELVIPIAARQ